MITHAAFSKTFLYCFLGLPRKGCFFAGGPSVVSAVSRSSPSYCESCTQAVEKISVTGSFRGSESADTAPTKKHPQGVFFCWWAIRVSNPGPAGYEPAALTTELMALIYKRIQKNGGFVKGEKCRKAVLTVIGIRLRKCFCTVGGQAQN